MTNYELKVEINSMTQGKRLLGYRLYVKPNGDKVLKYLSRMSVNYIDMDEDYKFEEIPNLRKSAPPRKNNINLTDDEKEIADSVIKGMKKLKDKKLRQCKLREARTMIFKDIEFSTKEKKRIFEYIGRNI